MAGQDFKASPTEQPDITSGQLGEEAGITHMRSFLKAFKAGDPSGMWTAFKAAEQECQGMGYGEPDKDDSMGMMG